MMQAWEGRSERGEGRGERGEGEGGSCSGTGQPGHGTRRYRVQVCGSKVWYGGGRSGGGVVLRVRGRKGLGALVTRV